MSDYEEYEEVDEDVVGATGPISLCCELSPDYAAKEGDRCIHHVGPPQMQFIRCTQNPTIDPTFEGFVQVSKWAETEVRVTFLTYLRRTILEGGGFSGFVGEPKAEWFVKNVCHGLYPF